MDDENYGPLLVCRDPLSYQHRTPARTKCLRRPLGKDNEAIYRRYLGLGPQELHGLAAKGVV